MKDSMSRVEFVGTGRRLLGGIGISMLLLLAGICPCWANPSEPPAETSAQTAPEAPAQSPWQTARRDAAALAAEGSFRAARERLEPTLAALPQTHEAWLPLRLNWLEYRIREVPSRARLHTEALAQVRTELQELAESLSRETMPWAETQRLLAKSYGPYTYQRWPFAQRALDWWLEQPDRPEARQSYFEVLWEHLWPRFDYPEIPLDTRPDTPAWPVVHYLEQGLRIAQEPEDIACLLLHLAQAQTARGGLLTARARETHARTLAVAQGTRWESAALAAAASYEEQYGRIQVTDTGHYSFQPNWAQALAHWEALLQLTTPNTALARLAQRRRADITREELNLFIGDTFLPETPVAIDLHARNLQRLQLRVYRTDPNTYFSQAPANDLLDGFSGRVSLPLATEDNLVWEASLTRGETPAHEPWNDSLRREQGLPAGFYVVQVQAESLQRTNWLLVTDSTLTVKNDHQSLLAWWTDAQSGHTLHEGTLYLWQRPLGRRGHGPWQTSEHALEAADNGLKRIPWTNTPERGRQWLLLANDGERWAIARDSQWARTPQPQDQWHIYAFTDMPAYRPGETVFWRAYARYRDTEGWQLPAPGAALTYQLRHQATGKLLASGSFSWNAYGADDEQWVLPEDCPLGTYVLFTQANGKPLASADIFQVEDYRRPEFEVAVQTAPATPRQESAGTGHRPGERINVRVSVNYYDGAPLAGGRVELQISRRPYHFAPPEIWPPIPGPAAMGLRPPLMMEQPAETLSSVTAQTDAQGRVTFPIDTDPVASQDWEYLLVATVTDASGIQLSGQGQCYVTRQPYFARWDNPLQLCAPQTQTTVQLLTQAAGGQGVAAQGQWHLNRLVTEEIWISPRGEQLDGQTLRQRSRARGLFSNNFNWRNWQLVSQLERVEAVASGQLQTDASGTAELKLSLPEAGRYELVWISRDRFGLPIRAVTPLWVASEDEDLIWSKHGPLNLVLPKRNLEVGESLPVLITSPVPTGEILLSVEANGLQEALLRPLNGSHAWASLTVPESWSPGVRLEALQVQDLQLWRSSGQVNVPPTHAKLTVTLTPSSETLAPSEAMLWDALITDASGQPVQAELSLAVFDAAVQQVPAPQLPSVFDFYYSETPLPGVQLASSFELRRYQSLSLLDEAAEAAKSLGQEAELMLQADGAMPRARSALGHETAVQPAMVMMDGSPSAGSTASTIQVRHDFRESAGWWPALQTNPEGHAQVSLSLPDTATRWQAVARAVALPARFGEAEAAITARLPLTAQLTTPRFLIQGDQATLSAVVRNQQDTPQSTRLSLALSNDLLSSEAPLAATVEVPAGQHRRVPFVLSAQGVGTTALTLTAEAETHGDAIRQPLEVLPHGMDARSSAHGLLRPAEEGWEGNWAILEFTPGSLDAQLTLSSSLRSELLANLDTPALSEHPLLPQVLEQWLRLLTLAQLDPRQSTQEHVAQELQELTEILLEWQNADGGFGWRPSARSTPHYSAQATWLMTLAEPYGIAALPEALTQARRYLSAALLEAEPGSVTQQWVLFALTSRFAEEAEPKPEKDEARIVADSWKNREHLSTYSRALLMLSTHALGFTDEASLLAENLANNVIEQGSPEDAGELYLAHWAPSETWYRWQHNPVETTAAALLALSVVEPDAFLAEGTANWLRFNRLGAGWRSERETTLALAALASYAKALSSEQASATVAVRLNDLDLGTHQLRSEAGATTLDLSAQLRPGSNQLQLQRLDGTAPVYLLATARAFTAQKPIPAQGSHVTVQRQYARLVPEPTVGGTLRPRHEPLTEPLTAHLDDTVEVRLRLHTDFDLEEVIVTDPSLAGLDAGLRASGEPLQLVSTAPGQPTLQAIAQWEAQGLRLLIDRLPAGEWEVRYTLQAMTPGTFHGLPAVLEVPAAPVIQGHSAETLMTIQE